jgi:ribonuclease T2
MKPVRAAFLLAMSAACLGAPAGPAHAASDCVLDRCADERQAPGAKTAGVSASSGRFDFYVLALSWSPGYCATGGDTRSRGQCAPGANPGFVVHGLWPQYAFGYPSNCPGDGFLPFSVLSNLGGLYPDQGLARHEWRQHGQCSGKPPSAYFSDVRAARDAVVIPPAFKAPREDQTLSPLDVQRAFIAANPRLRPGMMAVTCKRGMLQEARLCFSRDLRDFVACPQVARASCRSQSLVVPAGR